MREKNQKRLLGGILLAIFLVFLCTSYILVFLVPKLTEKLFGPPDPSLDNSARILYSFKLYNNRDLLIISYPVIKDNQIIIVEPGMTAAAVSQTLFNGGLIPDPASFNDYLVYKGIDRFLKSGTYLFDPQKSPIEIAADLYDENPLDIDFSFLAGWRAEEIASLLQNSGLEISSEEFLEKIQNPPESLLSLIPAEIDSLEGFLFPGNYLVQKSIDAQGLISRFLFEFNKNLPKDYKVFLGKTGLSLNQTVILASIVEKETILPEEAPIIASVFINRLNAGMPLQSDPTVQFAIGYDEDQKSWWKNPLDSEDLNTISSFNTYLNSRLPPSPICNPSLESLIAVFKPAETDYYYFRAACDGKGGHKFSETYENHLNAACD